MNRRQFIGVIGILLFAGVPLAWAVLSPSFSDTVWQTPEMRADVYKVGAGTVIANSSGLYGAEIYRGTQSLATYVASLGVGSVVTTASPYTYEVFKSGATYYANSTIGGTNYSSASFNTLWTNLMGGVTSGMSIHFKPGTYVYSTVLTAGGDDNISIVADNGAILQCDTAIATAGFMWTGSNENDHDLHITVKGLTFDNNLLTSGPFFKWVDNLSIEDCYIMDTVNASLRGGIVISATTLHPNLDVRIKNNHVDFAGGPGISLSYTTGFQVEGNYVNDVCQFDYPAGGAIKTDTESYNGTITDNNLTGVTKNDGIYLSASTSYGNAYTVTGNTITMTDIHDSATSGIKMYADNSVISGNTLIITGNSDGGTGLHICGQHNMVDGNVIRGGGTAWAGIYLEDSTGTDGYNHFSDNVITGFDTKGIENEQDYNMFTDNDILSIPTGIAHTAAASNNNVIGGSFRGTTTEISDSGTSNAAWIYIDKTGTYISADSGDSQLISPTGDDTGSGIYRTMTVGENVVAGEVLYMKNDGKLWKADADSNTTAPVVAIASTTILANNAGKVYLSGLWRDDAYAWTPGAIMYLSNTTGDITNTPPVGSGDQVQVIGYAVSATVIYFSPNFMLIELT